MKKRVLSLITVLAMTVGMLAGCGGSADKASADTKTETDAESTTTEGEASLADVKVGFIFLHDENSTYDLNFMNAAKEACEKLGVEYMTKTNIPGGSGVLRGWHASWQTQAATSSLQTALDMRIT